MSELSIFRLKPCISFRSFHSPSRLFSICPARTLLRFQVINLLHEHTLEMRGLRPEASAHSLLALMQLFEGRLAALRALSEPLVYHSQNLAHLVSWSVHRHMEEYKVDIADADIEQVPPQFDKLANTVSSCRIFASAYSLSLLISRLRFSSLIIIPQRLEYHFHQL